MAKEFERLEICVARSAKRGWPVTTARHWARKYPDLFTLKDLHHTRTQPDYHFPEWALAVHLRRRHGFWSLLKYSFRGDSWKAERVTRLLGRRRAAWLVSSVTRHHAQPPDLLVFDPRAWKPVFFAEAKGEGDSMRRNQRIFFALLQERLRIPVRIYRVRVG